MIKISATSLLIGLILCPAYLVYVTAFSGKEVGELVFIDKNVSVISVGGFSSTTSGGNTAKNHQSIDLSPDMNPVRFISKASYRKSGIIHQSKYSEFELDLSLDSQLLWSQKFNVSESEPSDEDKKRKSASLTGNTSTTSTIKLTDIIEVGNYHLKLKALPQQDVAISDLSVEVRRNVMVAKPMIWGSGILFIVLGILGLVLGQKNSRASS